MNTLTKITTEDIKKAIIKNGSTISRDENIIEVDIKDEAQLDIYLDAAFDYEPDECEIGYIGGWYVADFTVLNVTLFSYEDNEKIPINLDEVTDFINKCQITVNA